MERLKKIFTHNKIQKLSALIVSSALWLFVMGSQDPAMNGSYNVSVSLANPSREYRVIYDDQYVKVEVETPKNLSQKQKELLRQFEGITEEKNYKKRKLFYGILS